MDLEKSLKPHGKPLPLFPDMKKFHFVGIGGIGMSALAKALCHLGFEVSGSDKKENRHVDLMRKRGIRVSVGHDQSLEPGTSALVYSTAIQAENPELRQAQRFGIPLLHRSEVLAEFINKRPSISVTGTHGKTTTTAMVSFLLHSLGCEPTCLVGGVLLNAQDNVVLGSDRLYVAEVDESDKTQRRYFPLHSIITNMEIEHLDHYKDFEEIKTCFRSYGYQTRPEGYLVVNYDDLGLREMFQDYPNSILTYGMDRRADFWATDIRLSHYSADYRLFHKKQFLGNVHLELPGIHNVSNSLASLSLLIALGLDINKLIPAMAEFRGTGRRLEVKLNTQQLLVVDDYAHHPTEIRASLRALKAYGKPLTVVFQPHRFSRIRGLLHEFATAFYDADQLILTDIYGAGETEDGGLKIQDVLEAIQRSGHPNATFIQKAGLLNKLEPAGRPGGELFAFLGAGDIGEVADAFSIRFKG